MKTFTVVLLLAAGLMASLAVAQETRPAATQPAGTQPASSQSATQPSGPKIKLFATLKPGEKWAVLAKVSSETTYTDDEQRLHASKTRIAMDFVVTMDKGPEGDKALRASIKRIREESEYDGKKTTLDSDNPPKRDPGNDFFMLVNGEMKMQMDGKNKVVVTEGLGKVVQKMGGTSDPAQKQARVDYYDKLFSQLLLGGFDFLPPQGEVAVGETWTLKREHPLFVMPPGKEKQVLTCKLIRLDKAKEGQIATVEIVGDGKVEYDNKELTVTYTGWARFNVDKQQFLSAKLDVVSTLDKNTATTIIETMFTPADRQAATSSPAATAPATAPSTREAVEDRL